MTENLEFVLQFLPCSMGQQCRGVLIIANLFQGRQLGPGALGPNCPFFIGNLIIFNIFGSRINPRARRCPRWPRFGHFRPQCGPRWSGLGPYYPFFIGNQLIFNTFGSKINPRDRGCPPWPSFGPFPASMRSKGVEVGLKLSFFHLCSIPI